ncbi:hypothetical protein H4219_002670 [Mycoemilia scoparia]|uniref:Uncharacterized protein n=1 Tax=Mycoemilia scoparia TaxID=417184 RepID=A0A9W8DTR9_9FUNG|nr:hypothetical protein H4219_002670 [Mycoemilia scoparia]
MGWVVVHEQMYLLTSYITVSFMMSVASATKVLSWMEVWHIEHFRYHTKEDIYAYSKAIHAYVDSILSTLLAVFDKRIRKRSMRWFLIYLLCVVVSILNALASPAIPQLLQNNFTYLKKTDVYSLITSNVLTEKLENMTAKGNVDNVVFLTRQVNDGKYLWERAHQDVYTPENRTYTYISNWGHASPENSTDGSYPKSSPTIGKGRLQLGVDGFYTTISCHVIDCNNCSPELDSDNKDYLTPNKMGVTNLTLYNDNNGIQYRVFWGNGPKDSSGIGVAEVNKTGMIREASFDSKPDPNEDYNYYVLSPGRIKVNCDYQVLNNNGLEGSSPLIVNNTEFFKHTPFADVIFTQTSSTLDPTTVNSLLNEENILRNLTHNIHNSFRLMNDKLFRTQKIHTEIDGGFVQWEVKSNMKGYDLSIIIYATFLLVITFMIFFKEFLYMFKKRYVPLVTYAQDIDTRLSILALSDLPASKEHKKLFEYISNSNKDSTIEMGQEAEKQNAGNAQRVEDVLFFWEDGVFVPYYNEAEYQRLMKIRRIKPPKNSNKSFQPNSSNATLVADAHNIGQNYRPSTSSAHVGAADNQDIGEGSRNTPSFTPSDIQEFYNATHAQNSGGNSGSGNGHKRNPSLPQTPPTLQGAGGSSTRRDSDDNRSTRSQSFDESRQNNVPPRK